MSRWINGYKVDFTDWYDGVHDHMNIAYYKPGAYLNDPPFTEHGYLIRKDQRGAVESLLSSVVEALTGKRDFWEPYVPGRLMEVSIEPPKIWMG